MSQGFTALPTTGTLSGLTAVQDINTNEAALLTLNSGATAPSSPSAYQVWADTTTNLLKLYTGSTWAVIGILSSFPPMLGNLFGQKQSKSANYSLLLSDAGTLFLTTASLTLTIPGAQATPFCFAVSVSSGTTTVSPGSGTIAGQSSLTMAAGQSAIIATDGTNYQLVAFWPGFGTSGQLLTFTGASALPTMQAPPSVLETGTLASATLVVGTVYQNTTGKKRRLWVVIKVDATGTNYGVLNVGPTNPPTIQPDLAGTTGLTGVTAGQLYCQLYTEVPSTHYYQLTAGVGAITFVQAATCDE